MTLAVLFGQPQSLRADCSPRKFFVPLFLKGDACRLPVADETQGVMSTLLHFLLNDAELQIKILFSRRTDVDYGDFETIDANEAEDSLRLAEEVMENIEKLRKEFVAQI